MNFRRNDMKKIIALLLGTALLVSGCAATETSYQGQAAIGQHAAVTPVTKSTDWWMPRHLANKERIAQGGVDLLMIGDSITHGWERGGQAIWDMFYADRNAVNLGFSGDRTEHVLWRIADIDFSASAPKLAVVMIGTNNSNGDAYTAEQIADGIVSITRLLRQKLPHTEVLVLGIFPRGTGSRDVRKAQGESVEIGPQWQKVNEASALAARWLNDDESVYFLDINDSFLDGNGVLHRDIMPDLLHLSEKGYAIWAAAMEPTTDS
jgi:beta-glucosidase